MDVGFFLKDRIAFIRQFYDSASYPFLERKRKIEAGEEPFVPPYSEDGEPPFLSQWLEADDSLQILGYSCISMLSASLHLYLRTWEHELRVPVDVLLKSEFKRGWLNGYKVYFNKNFDIDFAAGSVNLTMLEEITLARNQIQHPSDIWTTRTRYSPQDIKKLPHVFFVDEIELRLRLLRDADDTEKLWLSPPRVYVTEENLKIAMTEVEKFSRWLEAEIDNKCGFR